MDWFLYLGGGFLTIGGAAVGYFAWAYNYFRGELKEDPTYRADAAKALTDHSWLQRYRSTLQRALDWLDRQMDAPSSLRALGVCVTVSLVYTLVFFLGSWVFGGPGTVGNTKLLPRLPWWQQAFWGGLALIYLSAMAWMAYRHERIGGTIQNWLSHSLRLRFGARAEAAAEWFYRLVGAGVAASILLAAEFYGGVSGAVVGAVAVAGAGALAVAGAVAGALAWAGAGTFIAATTFIIVVIGGDISNLTPIVWLLFFVTLPVVNAVLDWPSWWISRRLGQHLSTSIESGRSSGRRFGVIVVHALIDFVAAIVLLYLLAMALPFVIELFNLWIVANNLDKPLELRGFLNNAVNNPWPDGLWVLAMLLSTLVPTVLHAMALVASPVMVWLGPSERRKHVAMALQEEEPEPWAIREASWHKVWTWLIALVVPLAILALFIGAIGLLWRPVGGILLDAADLGMAGAFHVADWLGWIVP